MPLTTADTSSSWGIALSGVTDLSTATITFKMCVATSQTDTTVFKPSVANLDFSLSTFGYQPFDNSFQFQTSGTLTPCSTGLTDIVFTPASAGFNASTVSYIGITIQAAASAGPWSNPTVVRVDSITISNGAGGGPFTFDTSQDVESVVPGNPFIAGSTVTWVSM